FDPGDDPVVVLNNLQRFDVDFDTLEARLLRTPQIRSVTVTDTTPWSDTGLAASVGRSPEAGASGVAAQLRTVGRDYFETFSLDLLAGRAFEADRDRSDALFNASALGDPGFVVIDRRMAESLGFAAPEAAVGQTIYQPARAAEPNPTPARAAVVLGVVETEAMRLGAGSGGTVFQFNPATAVLQRIPAVRIDPSDVPAALAAIDAAWSELAPNAPLDARFLNDLFEAAYASFNRISATFVVLSIAALAISTTGILGIAVHVAARRRREMGVRKTLGARAADLIRLLLIDFSKPVLVANLLAWPLGYLAAQAYLQPFANRIELTPAPFLISMAITLAIAWAAVIGEVSKAASVRPAEVLRHA
ncbi:MAG: ABC transporter permease, partial [Maricaulaceae bacterium]